MKSGVAFNVRLAQFSLPTPIIFRLKGSRMPIVARLAPQTLLVGPLANSIEIQRVLDISIQIFHPAGLTGIELARQAAVQDRQRLCADVFTQLEELIKPRPKDW